MSELVDKYKAMKWECRYYGVAAFVFPDREDYPSLLVSIYMDSEPTKIIASRNAICEALRDFLNGGTRPQWLDDMERVSEDRVQATDGTWIGSVGPDNTQESCDKRVELIERLVKHD